MKRRITGPRAVAEAVRAQPGALSVVYVEEDARRALASLLEEARARGVKVEARTREDLDALAQGTRHQGVVAIGGEFSYLDLDVVLAELDARGVAAPLLVALDEITDPHNLGAILRSAVALGADAVITLKDRAAPVTPVVVRASAGATEHARVVRVVNLARTLATLRDERGMSVVGLDAGGEVPLNALPDAPTGRVLVVGSEGRGLRPLVRKQCDVVASIALLGPIASLNASVAAGIAVYEAARQRTR